MIRERRSQRGTPEEWARLDVAAARDGYATTARWLRDVGLLRADIARYRVVWQNGGGEWVPAKTAALTAAEAEAVVRALRGCRIAAKREVLT